MDGEELLARAAPYLAAERKTPVTFLLADPAGETPDVDDTQIPVFYRLVRGMDPRRVGELVAQAAAKLPPLPPCEPNPALAAVVGEHARTIGAEAEPDPAARAATAAVVQLGGADRARCLDCDDKSGQLWSGVPEDGEGGEGSEGSESSEGSEGGGAEGGDDRAAPAWSGIAGFAARAVAGVIVPHAAEDALYRA